MLFFCRILSLAYYFMAIYLEKSNLFLGFRFLFFKFSLIWLGNTEQCYGLSVLGTHQFNMILFDSFIFSCSPILCQLTYLQGETLEQIVYPKYCYKIDDRPWWVCILLSHVNDQGCKGHQKDMFRSMKK